MASIVASLAASHSPQLSTPAELWRLHAERDRANKELLYRGVVFDFESLVDARKSERLEDHIDNGLWQEKHARCSRAIDSLAETMRSIAPDIVMIVGDDQREMFLDDGTPTFAIYWGESVECIPKPEDELPPSLRPARWANYGEHREEYRCTPELGRHIIEQMMAEPYD